MPEKTTIIIPTHNQPDKLKKCLDSIRQNTDDYEILIIDNDADALSKDIMRSEEKAGDCRIIPIPGKIPDEVSLYFLWNKGVRQSKTRYVAIINDDIVVAPKWLYEMREIMEANPSVWCASPRYSAGEEMPKEWPNMKEENLQRARPLGFCFLTTKKVLERMKCFDETYKLWAGDSEFFLKLVIAKHPVIVATASYIHHFGSSTLHTIPNLHHKTCEDTKLYGQRWERYPIKSPYA